MITKTLPTEPGQYWFRQDQESPWGIMKIADLTHAKDVSGCFPDCEWSRIHDPDEVCEWERTNNYGWESSCGHETIIDVDFCPYCGLPVKQKEGQE